MASFPRSKREVPIVLAAAALQSFTTVSRAAALALPDLGFAAFFIAGITQAELGASAAWFVLAATLAGFGFRRLDIESWTLFIPGGLPGRAQAAFGPGTSTAASATVLVERLLLSALACSVVGHYITSFAFAEAAQAELRRHAVVADLSSVAAVALLGWLWLRARRGRLLSVNQRARHEWFGVGALLLFVVWGVATALARGTSLSLLVPVWHAPAMTDWHHGTTAAAGMLAALLAGFGMAAPAIGVGDGLSRAAAELPPPRSRGLRRTVVATGVYAVVVTVTLSFLYAALVPGRVDALWQDAPLAGIARALAGPVWLQAILAGVIAVAAVLMLGQTARAGLWGAEGTLSRLAERGGLTDAFRQIHPGLGTQARAIDSAGLATAVIILASGASVGWLARAYGAAVLWTLAFQSVVLIRLRRHPMGATARLPFTSREARRRPGSAALLGALVAAAAIVLIARADSAALAATAAIVGLGMLLAIKATPEVPEPVEADALRIMPAPELSIEQLEPSRGCLLVAVRNPYQLGHLEAALRTPRGREIVVMTARLREIDTDGDAASETMATAAERILFARVVVLAERYARPVRLVIVPAHDVFDAVIDTVLRLQASEVYVGESTSISAEAQARLLGDAWERAPRAEQHDVRLVIHHRSGRTDVYHVGAHAPTLTSSDLDLIHLVWLDAVRTLGPHVHHHDIVRAALTQMAEQLNGPDRDEALQVIRRTTKPADELAAVLHTRDYTRLRDMVRNRPASDLAELLGDLSPEDQAIAFRLLPRKDAAATFEYLEQDAREGLLKTLSKEDVASLVNDMAPDDRTMFLEELPATVTRELLALLTPQERAVAVTLLGYPEDSVGRLMTPDYIAVREDWTVQQVLEYVRAHGQDSETLNVIYVVDDQGRLIDDVRIREFLLTDPARRVSELMDRHFVVLTATDDQQTAVAEFRQYDRSALPVTDTAGVLIGIVTVDDVLDVAETEATKDIQRIGGSEALDEPYMEIAFPRMVRKRAGWLTALFLGEMLTATAMGFFENEINKAVVLTLFLPLIISSGGNSGSQASTLVIRALALSELTLRDWWRVMRREIAAGLSLGAVLAVIGFLRITIWHAVFHMYGFYWVLVALTVSLSLVGVVLWGTLVGSLLPFLLRRLGFDPATSSAPFVATLVDVTGLMIYFSVAFVVLRGTLL
ncbi:MAG TPA: magnesium transporter [Vicinamibacterales bacterium]|nr:magnesium transporter [Vicinamibacterales bacterium]